MKKRSIIALILVLMISLSVFMGCNNNEEIGGKETSKKTDDSAGKETSDEKEKEQQIEPQQDGEEHMEISVSVEDWSEFNPEEDEIAEIIQDKFNLTIKPVVFEEDGLKLAAASQSLPDVFETTPLFDVSLFNSWVSQGIVREVPDELIKEYPEIAKITETNKTAIAARELLGKDYMIIKPNSRNPDIYKVAWQGIFYRKDWAENVGITKVPETYEEMYEMLKAFVNNDPNESGKKDTYGLTSNGMGLINTWFTAWGVNVEDWIEEDGQWIPGYLSEKCIEPLKYVQRLYREGLLDTEFAQNSPVQSMQKFSGNTFGMIARNSDVYWIYRVIKREFGGANPDIEEPLDVVGLLPPLAKDSSSEPAIAEHLDSYAIQFRADLTDEKLNRYLELHEWLLSEEAKFLLNLGIEDVHYSKTADGKIVTFNDPETGQPFDIFKMYPSVGIRGLASWQFDYDADFDWPSTILRDDVKQVAKEIRDLRNQYPFPRNIEVSLISTPAKDSLELDISDDFAQMVMGKEDIEIAFEKFVQSRLAMGAQDAIDELNAKVK